MVFNIMRYCLHDGPGIRTVVFLKGCPLRCTWCHNPEGIDRHSQIAFIESRCIACGECFIACPEMAVEHTGNQFHIVDELCKGCGTCVDTCYADARQLVGKEMTVGAVLAEVEKDVVYYEESGGGVTFSGGEPFLQHRFLSSLASAAKKRRIHTAVETSGFTSPQVLEDATEYMDLFLYDVKLMDDKRHQEYTGVSNVLILENLKRLSSRGARIIVRMPVIPGVNDDEENIRMLAHFLTTKTSVNDVHLLPFHTIGRDKYQRIGKEYLFDVPEPLQKNRVESLVSILEHAGIHAVIGG